MQRRLTVHRIFPLEQFGNLQLTNELILEEGNILDEQVAALYDNLVSQVYLAALDHRELVAEMKEVETLDEKREVLNDGRD